MTITCRRCGGTGEAMAQPPFPGALGDEVHRGVCQACWREWLRAQVIVINEYRLNLMEPQARVLLQEQMRSFLNLAPERPA